ncbi:uncharacterized protein DSM5745_08478 [Aspergillus mulundensis]|uniref:Uncharacterized protein n=1 Tax=Aspergillus mulundensis TaxID=1810919 RepID=A0A3D8R432_9EURO|nr:hypothetical protein DSM5745_08478 [Aspergillus mulundensis]RDW68718.1 hypothetical protein DSM5745_08478 [Aspergillus mulundensis]
MSFFVQKRRAYTHAIMENATEPKWYTEFRAKLNSDPNTAEDHTLYIGQPANTPRGINPTTQYTVILHGKNSKSCHSWYLDHPTGNAHDLHLGPFALVHTVHPAPAEGSSCPCAQLQTVRVGQVDAVDYEKFVAIIASLDPSLASHAFVSDVLQFGRAADILYNHQVICAFKALFGVGPSPK